MLRLLGRKADGWLPSLSWVGGVEGLARGNALIDEAAVEAGRDPRSIRRLLNLFGDIPLEDLVSLATEVGVSTFITTGDDPAAMQRFAEEVHPRPPRPPPPAVE